MASENVWLGSNEEGAWLFIFLPTIFLPSFDHEVGRKQVWAVRHRVLAFHLCPPLTTAFIRPHIPRTESRDYCQAGRSLARGGFRRSDRSPKRGCCLSIETGDLDARIQGDLHDFSLRGQGKIAGSGSDRNGHDRQHR